MKLYRTFPYSNRNLGVKKKILFVPKPSVDLKEFVSTYTKESL